MAPISLTKVSLEYQDARTSAAIIDEFKSDDVFVKVSKQQTKEIITRDEEDAEKLAAGIQLAVDRSVLKKQATPPQYTKVDVTGKTPNQVADEIMSKVDSGKGAVVVLCGLSGTGKGTTVATLKKKLGKTCVTWSNGNIFRSLTYLCSTWCEQQGKEFSEAVLTPENVQSWMGMLEFKKFNGAWDTHISGLGVDMFVLKVANTELKGPKVRGVIPTVAKFTQGEVVKFASAAVNDMGKDGLTVLVEGREQTVNYIDTPYRFCLTMADTSVIGMRRAAQVIGAQALKRLQENPSESPRQACQYCLKELADKTPGLNTFLDRLSAVARNPAFQVGLLASAVGVVAYMRKQQKEG